MILEDLYKIEKELKENIRFCNSRHKLLDSLFYQRELLKIRKEINKKEKMLKDKK